jgi:hypothetical protein
MRLALALLGIVLFATEARAQEFQWWGEVDVTAFVRPVDVLGLIVTRTDSTLPNPQLLGGGLEGEVRVLPHLTLTGGCSFVDLPQRGRLHVQLPLVAATPNVSPKTPQHRGSKSSRKSSSASELRLFDMVRVCCGKSPSAAATESDTFDG